MPKKYSRILRCLAILLIVCLLSGCAAKSQVRYFANDSFGKTRFADMQYEHYDIDALMAKIDAFTAAAKNAEQGQKLIAAYDEIMAEVAKLDTMSALSIIRYTQNANDAQNEKEYSYMQECEIKAQNAAMVAIRDALKSPSGAYLRAHLDTQSAREFLAFRDMSEREQKLAMEELELDTEYDRLMLNLDVAAQIDGESWTMERLQEEGDTLDEAKKSEISEAIEKELNLTAGGIYQELLLLRDEQAKLAGYDNYIDYAYKEIYRRDYTKEDARAFHRAVKQELGPAYYKEITNKTLLQLAGRDCKIDEKNVLNYIGKYAKDISPELYESYKYMQRYKLCDFTADARKLDKGFTTSLPMYDAPFIYNMCYPGNARTLSDSVHEFGHFTAGHYVPKKNILTDSMSYDIAEVNSQGLELLYDEYYEDIFGKKDAPLIRARHLSSLLGSIVSGCIEDEFQQYAYTHIDASVEELNRAYCDIVRSYGYDYGDKTYDYEWMYIHHTFSSPFYYISYATSALTSLDIWVTAQENREAAIDQYLRFTSFGVYDYDYLELLKICDMGNFTDAEYVNRITGITKDAVLELVEQAIQ